MTYVWRLCCYMTTGYFNRF